MKKTIALLLSISMIISGCATTRNKSYERCIESANNSKDRQQSIKDCQKERDDWSSKPSAGVDNFLGIMGVTIMMVVVCGKGHCK